MPNSLPRSRWDRWEFPVIVFTAGRNGVTRMANESPVVAGRGGEGGQELSTAGHGRHEILNELGRVFGI